MVREGHYPKFSEMIDKIEKIALEYVKFETYLSSAKKGTNQDRQDQEDILTGKKTVDEIDARGTSMGVLPTMSNFKAAQVRTSSQLSHGGSDS